VTPDSDVMRRVRAIQQRQGYVTLAEIKSILPVDSMTPEEIGKTVAQLEEGGIDIKFDRELLRRRPDSGLTNAPLTSQSRSILSDANRPVGEHTVQGSLLPQSAPPLQQRLSTVGRWWRPRAGQFVRTLLILALLCLLILAVVMR
jgi:Sigma-70 factor, region 1.1